MCGKGKEKKIPQLRICRKMHKPDGKVGNLQKREIKDVSRRQECKLSVKSGYN